MEALARTSSSRERARTAAAQALTASLERDAAQTSAELAAVRRAMLATRATLDDGVADAPLGLGDLEEAEQLLRICGMLTPKDLARLACSAASFGRKIAWQRSAVAGRGAEMRSVVEETARRWVTARSAREQELVAQWSGWLRRMHEIQTSTAVFSRSHPSIVRSEDGAVALCCPRTAAALGQLDWDDWDRGSGRCCTAASAVGMRDGRHYASFTLLEGSYRRGQYMCIGLIRPSWDVEGERDAHRANGHCFYSAVNGWREPVGHGWEGSDSASEGDTIGLLLDFDSGSLSVFKNGQRLGVMATGLEGVYCWAVSLDHEYGKSVRIRPAPAPAAPTLAEVAAALEVEAVAKARAAAEAEAAHAAAVQANLRYTNGRYIFP